MVLFVVVAYGVIAYFWIRAGTLGLGEHVTMGSRAILGIQPQFPRALSGA